MSNRYAVLIKPTVEEWPQKGFVASLSSRPNDSTIPLGKPFYGDTPEKAKANLMEALQWYIRVSPECGLEVFDEKLSPVLE